MTFNRQLPFAVLLLWLSLGGTNGFLELPGGAFNDLEEVTLKRMVGPAVRLAKLAPGMESPGRHQISGPHDHKH